MKFPKEPEFPTSIFDNKNPSVGRIVEFNYTAPDYIESMPESPYLTFSSPDIYPVNVRYTRHLKATTNFLVYAMTEEQYHQCVKYFIYLTIKRLPAKYTNRFSELLLFDKPIPQPLGVYFFYCYRYDILVTNDETSAYYGGLLRSDPYGGSNKDIACIIDEYHQALTREEKIAWYKKRINYKYSTPKFAEGITLENKYKTCKCPNNECFKQCKLDNSYREQIVELLNKVEREYLI